jgi:hypothetical protein
MRRGTIGFFGEAPALLPSFRRGSTYEPLYLRLALLDLRRQGFAVDDQLLSGSYVNYHGDFIEGGRGEIVVRA